MIISRKFGNTKLWILWFIFRKTIYSFFTNSAIFSQWFLSIKCWMSVCNFYLKQWKNNIFSKSKYFIHKNQQGTFDNMIIITLFPKFHGYSTFKVWLQKIENVTKFRESSENKEIHKKCFNVNLTPQNVYHCLVFIPLLSTRVMENNLIL